MTIKQIETQREAILEQLRQIRTLYRGTINEQFFLVPSKSTNQSLRRGPYFVLSRREGTKTISRRLSTAEDLDQARQDVAAHKQFVSLCRRYEELTERLGQLERQGDDGKKNRGDRRRQRPGGASIPRDGGAQ